MAYRRPWPGARGTLGSPPGLLAGFSLAFNGALHGCGKHSVEGNTIKMLAFFLGKDEIRDLGRSRQAANMCCQDSIRRIGHSRLEFAFECVASIRGTCNGTAGDQRALEHAFFVRLVWLFGP